ncbi:MAG: alpha/beta fold hydrolase [Elusimicrobia bacterium]|nr:alpha/beta fold hydrolase [Elusimicrobiota bacterium]
MTKIEIINWLIFALALLSAAAVLAAYFKSNSILRPVRRRTPEIFSPDQFGLSFETIDFSTVDGLTLKGWFIPAVGGETEKTVILCHGWGSNRGELMRDTHFLAEKGFNLFYFDFRASGESKGVLSSVGYLETRDFDAAYAFLKTNRPMASGETGVFGTSMGGSVAIYAAAKYPEINCLLAENTFLSYNGVIANWSWMRMKVPYWPILAMTLFFVRVKLGVDPEPYSPIHNIGRVKLPVLFINGDHDDLVPLADAEKLYGLCPSETKRMWVIAGASHGRCAEVGGEIYKGKVSSFFEENLAAAAPKM